MRFNEITVQAPFVARISGTSQPSIAASAQTVEANVVEVASVVSAGPGFVALYRSDASGAAKTASRIGSSPVEDGLTEDLEIVLTGYVANKESVVARLHVDQGSEGTFEPNGADLPATLDGAPVEVKIVLSVTTRSQPTVGVNDQTVELNTVAADRVNSFVPVAVVLYASGTDGKLDASEELGHKLLTAGLHEDVSIVLEDYVGDGEKLWLRLHGNSGDAADVAAWDGPDGDPPLKLGASSLERSFTVSVTDSSQPRVGIADQKPIAGDSLEIVVDEVVALEEGWVVIRRADAGGAMVSTGNIGYVSVPAGLSTGVKVILTDFPAANEKLFAALHADRGTQGTYQFPGVNAAVLFGGEPLAASFTALE